MLILWIYRAELWNALVSTRNRYIYIYIYHRLLSGGGGAIWCEIIMVIHFILSHNWNQNSPCSISLIFDIFEFYKERKVNILILLNTGVTSSLLPWMCEKCCWPSLLCSVKMQSRLPITLGEITLKICNKRKCEKVQWTTQIMKSASHRPKWLGTT